MVPDGRGSRAAERRPPCVALLVCYGAALRLGAVIVPANTAYKEQELAHILNDSGALLAVVDDLSRLGRLPVRAIDVRSVTGGDEDADGDLPPVRADELAMISYTSGTTGRPKGATLTHRNLLASADAVRMAWRWRPDDGLLLMLPLFHVHGLLLGWA